MQPAELRKWSHEALIARATALGVSNKDAEGLTQAELIDEIVRRMSAQGRKRKRGWFGKARDLVAQVIDRGLHLPEAAKLFRTSPAPDAIPNPPAPLPTITLAEIYAAQGYFARAVKVLDEVIKRQPANEDARKLRGRYVEQLTPTQRSKLQPAPPDNPTEAKTKDVTAAATAAEGQSTAAASDDETTVDLRHPAAPEPTSPEPSSPEPTSPEPTSPEPSTESDGKRPASAPSDELDTTVLRDELVVLATDPYTAYAYWELRPVRYARMLHQDPNGNLVLRVLSVKPSPRGETFSEVQDLPLDQLVGDTFIHGLAPGAELRLCVAWKSDEAFTPLIVAAELQQPRDYATAVISGHRLEWRVAAEQTEGQPNRDTAPRQDAAQQAAGARDAPKQVATRGANAYQRLQDYFEAAASKRPVPVVDFGSAGRPRLAPLPHGGASELAPGASELALAPGASELMGD